MCPGRAEQRLDPSGDEERRAVGRERIQPAGLRRWYQHTVRRSSGRRYAQRRVPRFWRESTSTDGQGHGNDDSLIQVTIASRQGHHRFSSCSHCRRACAIDIRHSLRVHVYRERLRIHQRWLVGSVSVGEGVGVHVGRSRSAFGVEPDPGSEGPGPMEEAKIVTTITTTSMTNMIIESAQHPSFIPSCFTSLVPEFQSSGLFACELLFDQRVIRCAFHCWLSGLHPDSIFRHCSTWQKSTHSNCSTVVTMICLLFRPNAQVIPLIIRSCVNPRVSFGTARHNSCFTGMYEGRLGWAQNTDPDT